MIIVPRTARDQPHSFVEFEVIEYNRAALAIARGKESHVVACTEAKGSSFPLHSRPHGPLLAIPHPRDARRGKVAR